MADDKEFEMRQEREQRLKNIDSQMEEESMQQKKRKEIDKKRRTRQKKVEEKRKLRKSKQEESEAKKAKEDKAKKDEMNKQSKDIMEKNRQAKKQNLQKPETIITGNRNTYSSDNEGSVKSLAADSVDTDIYLDDKKASIHDLPEDLVKKIRKEQEKAIRDTEKEINNSENKDNSIERKKINSDNKSNINPSLFAGNAMNLGNGNNGIFTDNSNKINSDLRGINLNNIGNVSNTTNNKEFNEKSNSNKTEDGNDIDNQNTIDNNINEQGKNRDNIRDSLFGLADNNPNNTNNSNNINKSTINNSNKRTKEENDNNNNNTIFTTPPPKISLNSRKNSNNNYNSNEVPYKRDIDKELTNNLISGLGRTTRVTKGAGNGIKKSAGLAKKALKAKKFFTVGALLGFAGIFLVILIVVVGAVSFIMNMPGMVRDKIVDTWDTIWQTGKGLIVGQDKPTGTQIKNLAEYLESMGYDLKYNGFVTKLEKDNEGNIKEIESKYLASYIAAEQRSYLIANENHNVKAIWQGIFDTSKWDEPWGTGMIVLEQSLLESIYKGISVGNSGAFFASIINGANAIINWLSGGEYPDNVKDISALSTRIIIKRDTKEMFISKVDIRDIFNLGGYDVYRYSLKEWTEKYGTPTELFITLHLATRAPEFAYNFATLYDTKVFMKIKELTDVQIDLVYAQTDKDNKVMLDKDGKPIMKLVSQMSNEELRAKGLTDSAIEEMRKVPSKITAFTPYITQVRNHWYYDKVIFQGEYNGKKMDVYQIENLAQGKPGYERYYAYTMRDNSDQGKIEEDTKPLPVTEGNSFLGGLLDIAFKAMEIAFTGGFSGISGFMQFVSESALNQAYNMLSDAVVDQISSTIKDILPNQLAGLLNVDEFLKGNLSLENLQDLYENGVTIGNMNELVNFDKISNYMSIDKLEVNVKELWDELNLQEELLNMDIAGLGSINDLENTIQNINLDNLNNVIDKQFGEIADLTNVNFDKLTNNLVNGFSSSIPGIQDSIVNTCDQLFSGLSEADFAKISDRMLGDISKNLSDLASTPILNQLDSSIKKVVEGKFDKQILAGLQNEFSKQITGLSYESLSNLASIPNMDFNKLKEISGQVTGITSALNGAEKSISNVSNEINKLATQISGMDVKVINSLSKSLEEVDKKISNLEKEGKELNNIIKSNNLTVNEAKQLQQKVNELEKNIELLKQANNELDMEKVNILKNDIQACKNDISRITNTISNIDDATIGKITSQVEKLGDEAESVINHIESFDINKLERLKYYIPEIDKSGTIQLAMDLYNMDVSQNEMLNLIKKYGTDLSGLQTSEINTILGLVNDKNKIAQEAVSRISKYLLKNDEDKLRSTLYELNSTVNLLSDLTNNFDINTAMILANKVPGLDLSHLNNIASQISNLQNATIEDLLKKVEEAPKKIVEQVSKNLTDKVVAGVKDQISQNLSEKIKGKINTEKFNSSLKGAMTSGPSENTEVGATDQVVSGSEFEYSTGFYVREIRHADYFQKAEPLRVLYPASHWKKMFREDKYVILDNGFSDMQNVENQEYIEKYGKTIWEATDGQIATNIYAMLQGIQSSDSQYLLRYFKELFTDFDWVFKEESNSSNTEPGQIKSDTIGWLFKTAKVKEPVFIGEPTVHSTLKQKISIKDIDNIHNIAINNMPNGGSFYTEKHTQPKVEKIKTLPTRPLDKKISVDTYAKQNMPPNAIKYSYSEYDASTEEVEFDYRYVTVDYYGYPDNATVDLEITYFSYKNSELQEVEKAEFEPYIWTASQIGILNSEKLDPVYGFKEGLDIVSPVNGVVVAKTEARTNELGEKVAESITIELRNTGDPNADGMRIILMGADFTSSGVIVGTTLSKKEYRVDADGNYSGDTSGSLIGKTTDEAIKIIILDKDQTPVDDVSKYIKPPYQKYNPTMGGDSNGKK